MKKFTRLLAIALALSVGGGLVFAAIQGTSIDTDNANRATVFKDGIRVGHFMDNNVTRNPAGKLGFPTFQIARVEWDAPVKLTSSTIVNSWDFGNDSGTTDCSGFTLTTPDYPRSLACWLEYTDDDDAQESITATLTITGTGYYSESITDDISISAVTSGAATQLQTAKAFKTVTAVTFTGATYGTGYGATSMTLDIGYPSGRLGLPYRVIEGTAVAALFDDDGTGGCVADSALGTFVFGVADVTNYSSTSADYRGLWSPATIPDNTNDYVLYFIPTDLENLYYGQIAPGAY